MKRWTATLQELREDHDRMERAHHALAPVFCAARIAFHDSDQEAVKIMGPTPRMIAALMAGGYIRHVRVVGECEQTGRPIMEGTGEIMDAMTHDEAVAFVAWKDLPPGCNHFAFLTTDDLPRIDGCAVRARAFRAAWRLEEDA